MNEELTKKAIKLTAEGESLAGLHRRWRKEGTISCGYNTFKSRIRRQRAREGTKEIKKTEEKLLQYINRERTIEDIQEYLDIPDKVLKAYIEVLEGKGYEVLRYENKIKLNKKPVSGNQVIKDNWKGNKELQFGVVSDTHMCNKYQQLTYLHKTYEEFAKRGIETVYHCGDISDGFYKNRPDHIYELFKHGADEQAEYIIKNYPKIPGITTRLISGNHDHTHIKNGGADICKRIALERDDIDYLGKNYARIMLTDNCIMDMQHPGDGSSYALSYSSQKMIDSLQGGSKPNILLIGHHHKAIYYPYRNIQTFEVPCLEAQTPFMKSKRIATVVAAWLINVSVSENGSVKQITPTLFNYYKMLENDY